MGEALRVLLNADLPPGGHYGGVEQFVAGLVYGLGRLTAGPERYVVVVPAEAPDWLAPYLGPNQRLAVRRRERRGSLGSVRALLDALGPAGATLRSVVREGRRRALRRPAGPAVPESGGFYESFGADVVHFPFQHFVRCAVPTVYNPHDLQHRHLPDFFTAADFAARETTYQAGCRESAAVAVEARCVRADLIRHYAIQPDKIQVIPMAAPSALDGQPTDADVDAVRQKYALPPDFMLFPAQTWPHKNHLRLLQALRLVRDQHQLSLRLVCTGRRNDFWPEVQRVIHELDLTEQVQFLDFVSRLDLRALYRLAQFLVFPSLFEGGAFPLLEAFWEGTPAACSAVTSLPEYAGDAALLFDPTSPQRIADALVRMSTDPGLRADLRRRAGARSRRFDWERTATGYRALYRKVAGRPLSAEDRQVLAGDALPLGPGPA
jgi:glycosyltransferase involved in cell wall biosynthesis